MNINRLQLGVILLLCLWNAGNALADLQHEASPITGSQLPLQEPIRQTLLPLHVAQINPELKIDKTPTLSKLPYTKDLNKKGTCYELRDCGAGLPDAEFQKNIQLKICISQEGCSWKFASSRTCTVAEFIPNPKRCGGKNSKTSIFRISPQQRNN